MNIIEIKKKSVVPVYGVAAVWVLYCVIFPLYRTWHFVVLACLAVIAYFALTALFPGKKEYIEVPTEPARTGDEQIDALLLEGEKAVSEMRSLRDRISDQQTRQKTGDVITVTEKIFKRLHDDPDSYKRVRRFADFYLPATTKLLRTYDSFGSSGASGDNVTGALEQIGSALDTLYDSYKKFFDSLFQRQALDIEADIRVLETMLKKEGLMGRDF